MDIFFFKFNFSLKFILIYFICNEKKTSITLKQMQNRRILQRSHENFPPVLT